MATAKASSSKERPRVKRNEKGVIWEGVKAFARDACTEAVASHLSNSVSPSHLSVFRREWPKATGGRAEKSWVARELAAAEGVSAEAGEWVVAEAA